MIIQACLNGARPSGFHGQNATEVRLIEDDNVVKIVTTY
jgi:hypothetical protein